ncbi:MAG: RDD family protein [Anaerolineae bacterium]
MLLNPTQLLQNRYQILRLIKRGGYGNVYLAQDTRLQIPVAIKENLDTSLASQQQFQFEASVLARLAQRHPGLPRVSDFFLEQSMGRQYLVMDYVQGEDLQTVLAQRGAQPEPQVLEWISQVMDALEYLHRQNPPIIHRDIKPANIKLRPDGKVILVDFGIAKAVHGGTRTVVGARGATDGFSPPEQYSGGTTPRSDVYALGAAVFCLLTNCIPPSAPERYSGKPLPFPRHFKRSISMRTEQAVLKAMDLNAQNRFGSITEFRQALPFGSSRPQAAWQLPTPPPQTAWQSATPPPQTAWQSATPSPQTAWQSATPSPQVRPVPLPQTAQKLPLTTGYSMQVVPPVGTIIGTPPQALPTVVGPKVAVPITASAYLNPAEFSDRLVAFIIDSVILSTLMTIVWCLGYFVIASFATAASSAFASTTLGSYDSISNLLGAIVSFLTMATPIGISLFYYALFYSHSGQTPGKKISRIRLVRDTGQPLSFKRAAVRFLLSWISGLPFYFGYWWVLWDPKKQAWHDHLTRTYVVKD